jgi:hypothetical protein
MKKRHVDHVLRAAGRIRGERQFIIIGSQALHGKYPDLPDEIAFSAEVDLIAKGDPDRGELLNAIGQDSTFHETHGYYADPVDLKTAILPKGWQGRLVNLPPGDTEGVTGLCLEPHDLAISKYVARREKDVEFTRELARLRLVERDKLLDLIDATPVPDAVKARIKANIEQDFRTAPAPKATRKRK